jgi:hypothetical protein
MNDNNPVRRYKIKVHINSPVSHAYISSVTAYTLALNPLRITIKKTRGLFTVRSSDVKRAQLLYRVMSPFYCMKKGTHKIVLLQKYA